MVVPGEDVMGSQIQGAVLFTTSFWSGLATAAVSVLSWGQELAPNWYIPSSLLQLLYKHGYMLAYLSWKNGKEELKLRLIEPDWVLPIYFALTMAASTLLPWVDAFSPQKHCFSLFLYFLFPYFFSPGALFSPTVTAAVAV